MTTTLDATIKDRLQLIFRRVFHAPDLNITEALTAWDVQGWDSLANVQLLLDIESEFQIRFSSSEIVRLQNVGEMLALIHRKLSSARSTEP